MAIKRNWQRGSADLIQVAVSLLVMAAVTAGTSAALVYGRETLIRQEHYKAAAYILHGYMESQQAAMQIEAARSDLSAGPMGTDPLDSPGDHNGRIETIYCHTTRDLIEEHHAQELGGQFAFYRITMTTEWVEREQVGGDSPGGQRRTISFTTSTIPRVLL